MTIIFRKQTRGRQEGFFDIKKEREKKVGELFFGKKNDWDFLWNQKIPKPYQAILQI